MYLISSRTTCQIFESAGVVMHKGKHSCISLTSVRPTLKNGKSQSKETVGKVRKRNPQWFKENLRMKILNYFCSSVEPQRG